MKRELGIIESDLWRRLRDGTKKVVGLHWTRIESGLTVAGIPDIYGCFMTRSRWVEQKRGFPFNKPWRAEQRIWAIKEIAAGGRVWLMSADSKSLFLFDVRKMPHIVDIKEADMEPTTISPLGDWNFMLETVFGYE